MSIEKRRNGYRVRWRENGQPRSRQFTAHADAKEWEREVERLKQRGALAVKQLTGKAPSLDTWVAERWAPEHAAYLAVSTRERYADVYKLHIAPRLGNVPINRFDVALLRSWQRWLHDQGAGDATILKARAVLSSVLTHAGGEIGQPNALSLVRAPAPPQSDGVRPLPPATVEAIRQALLHPAPRQVEASRNGQRKRVSYELPAPGDPQTWRRDALIVSLMAYAGMRPGELRALPLDGVLERTVFVQWASNPDGSRKPTKNRHRRSIDLLTALAQDVREYRLAAGRPSGRALILRNDDDTPWTKNDWNEWVKDRWAPALRQAGVDYQRPYDLRHSFASLLLAQGKTHRYVAGQLGHSVAVLISTYEHLFPEYEGDRIDANQEIASARAAWTPVAAVAQIGAAAGAPQGSGVPIVSRAGA